MSYRSSLYCLIAVLCIATFSVSCKKGCPTCHTYGYNSAIQAYSTQVCINSSCTCPNGFEGDSCQIYSINKYIQPTPNWLAYDACSGNTSYYVYMTTNPPYYTYFYINNLFNLGTQVTAQLASSPGNTSTYIYIPTQTAGSTTFSGQGFYQLSGTLGKLTINLDYNQSGIDQNCQVILYQQQ